MNRTLRFLLRWTFRLGLLLIVLLVMAYLMLDFFARKYVIRQIHEQTGLVATIDKVRVGVFRPGLTIKNLKLFNSADFGGSAMIDLPELHVEYDAVALLNGKFHSRVMRFDLEQVNIVQDKDGRRNLEQLEQRLAKASVSPTPKVNSPHHHSGNDLQFGGIDKLELTLGTIRFVQLTTPPQTNEFPLNITRQVFNHIHSEQDLYGVLITALLKSHANILTGPNGGPGLLQQLAQPGGVISAP